MDTAKRRWSALTLLLCLALTPAWAARKEKPDPEKLEYARKMDELHDRLVVARVFVDHETVWPGQVLKASSLLINNSAADLTDPQRPGDAADGPPTLGKEIWYLKQLGKGPTATERREGLDGRTRLGERVHQVRQLKAGASIELDCPEARVDPVKLKLREGNYEVTVDFVNEDGRVVATGTQLFRVKIHDPREASMPEGRREAALLKMWQPNFEMLPMTLSATTVSRGEVVQARCVVRNTAGLVELPFDALSLTPWKEDFGHEQWLFGRCVYVRSCDRARAPDGGVYLKSENPHPQFETGYYLHGFGGQQLNFHRKDRTHFAPGEELVFSKTIKTADLEPGTYEIRLSVGGARAGDVGVRRQFLTVTP